jgi:hypothetical protein
MTSRTTLALAGLLAILPACRPDAAAAPAAIEYGTDLCAECRNPIGDPRFAGQYRLGAAVKRFDDPGCLVRALRTDGAAANAVYLRGPGDVWIGASDAWLAHTPATRSPRGYGWVAYADFGSAQEAVTAAGAGELLSFEDALGKIAR